MWDIIEIGADLFQAVLAIYFMRKTCNLRTHPLRYDFLAIMLMASSIFITSQFEVYLIDSINDIIPMLFAMLFTQNRKYTCVFWAIISSIIVAVGTSISSTIIARLTGASWERMLEQNNVRITYLISANMLIAGIYIFVGNLGRKSHPISQAAMACFLITVIAQLAAAECFFTVGITLEKDVISVIGSLFLFVSMVITVAIYETMMQQAQKQKDLEVAYQTTQLINAHQEELKTMYSSRFRGSSTEYHGEHCNRRCVDIQNSADGYASYHFSFLSNSIGKASASGITFCGSYLQSSGQRN